MPNVVTAPSPEKVEQRDLGSLKEARAPTTNVSLSQAGPSTSTKASPGVTGMTGVTQDIGEGSSSAKQATDIMSESSPLMRQARNEGMLSAAKRGLANSSIAAGASQAAATKAAVPLAQQDAAAEQRQELANQAALQQAEQVSVTDANKANLVDVTEQNKMQQQYDETRARADVVDATEQNKAAMQKHSTDAEVNRTWLSGEISQTMAQIQGQYQELIAVNQSAASMYGSTLDSLASMWANSEVPIKQKNAFTSSTMSFLQNGLKVTASIADMEFRTGVGESGDVL